MNAGPCVRGREVSGPKKGWENGNSNPIFELKQEVSLKAPPTHISLSLLVRQRTLDNSTILLIVLLLFRFFPPRLS